MIRYVAMATVVLGLAATTATAVVIDHDDVAGVGALSQSVMDAVGQQKWFFTHASVGGNMIEGMNALHTSNATRYQLQTTGVGFNGAEAYAPPTSTVPGMVYECNRGNDGWSAKFTEFYESVKAGWQAPKVNFVMDKLCYIDQGASATAYLSSMSSQESHAAYAGTTFVYTTMPLTTDEDSDNVLRNQYNTAVRNYCLTNNKLLFDIADIESHDPSGNASTFVLGGTAYQKLYSSYSSDGGHLNSTGEQQVALGWYATAASVVTPEPSAIALLLTAAATFFVAGIRRKK